MAGDVEIKFTADTRQLNSELQKIDKNLSNVADATQGAANDLSRGLDKIGDSAKGAAGKMPELGSKAKKAGQEFKGTGKSARDLAGNLESVEGSAGETSSIMSGLAGALAIVSPEAAEAAQSLGDAAGGLEAVARTGPSLIGILGPVAVAVGAGALAFKKFSDDLEEAEDRMRAAAAQAARMSQVFGRLETTKARIALELAVAKGEADQQQLVELNARERAAAEFQKPKLEAAKLLAAAQTRVAAATEHLAAVEADRNILAGEGSAADLAHREAVEKATAALNVQIARRDKSRTVITRLRGEEEKLKGQILEIAAIRERESKKDSGGGGGGRGKAAAEAAQAERERLAAIKAQAAALAGLEKIRRSAQISGLEGEEKIRAVYQDQITALKTIAGEHVENQKVQIAVAEAQAELEKNRERELADLRSENMRRFQEENEAAWARAEENHNQELARIQEEKAARLAASAELAGSSAQLFEALSQNVGDMNKGAALSLFRISKGLTVAEIGLSTAEGLMTAATLPPPVDAIKAASVIAQSGASLAMVAAQKPSFHTGTGFVKPPSERRELNARLRAGEAVSTPLGAEIMGRDRIERANAGMSESGRDRPVVFQYEHRMFSRFIRDNVRMGGPISEELNRGRNTGHRG
jgi:methyl-accepting chemotaxis protein